MRFDLPHEIPRRRQREDVQLEPGPVERRREQLADRALENRGPQVKPPKVEMPRQTEPSRQIKDRAVLADRHVDHRPRRNDLPSQAVDLSLRAEEQKVLSEIARFRVIATHDLAETVYGNRPARMERDLAFLVEHGLVKIDAVNARRDGRGGRVEHLEVVTLTKAGRNLVIETAGLPHDQKLYAGLVKPREVEHDTQIYRAYLKEAQRIEGSGGSNLRVRLDFELKAGIQKAIHAERKAAPERDLNEIKQQVAERFDLPFVDNGIQIPDARIEYDTDQGSRSGHADIEVLTAAYRPGHIRGKAQAGFSLYASASDRATLTAKIENEHHLLDNILEL
jgi:hypothetical protein